MYWALIWTLLDTRITKKTQITFSDWSSNYQQWQLSLNKVVVWVSFTRLAVALNIRRVTTVDVIQRHQWYNIFTKSSKTHIKPVAKQIK